MGKVFKWQKRIGDCHIAGVNETLCGKPMLGNNYADQEKSVVDCEICIEENNQKPNEND